MQIAANTTTPVQTASNAAETGGRTAVSGTAGTADFASCLSRATGRKAGADAAGGTKTDAQADAGSGSDRQAGEGGGQLDAAMILQLLAMGLITSAQAASQMKQVNSIVPGAAGQTGETDAQQASPAAGFAKAQAAVGAELLVAPAADTESQAVLPGETASVTSPAGSLHMSGEQAAAQKQTSKQTDAPAGMDFTAAQDHTSATVSAAQAPVLPETQTAEKTAAAQVSVFHPVVQAGVSAAVSQQTDGSGQAGAEKNTARTGSSETMPASLPTTARVSARSSAQNAGAGTNTAGGGAQKDPSNAPDAAVPGGVAAGTAQSTAAHRLDVTAGAVSEHALPASTASQVADAVKEAWAGQRSELRVHLSPEDLGGITIKLVSQGGGLTVSIVADNARTGQMLTAGLDSLRSAMQAGGVPVQKADVAFTPASAAQSQPQQSDYQQPQGQSRGRQYADRQPQKRGEDSSAQAGADPFVSFLV